MLIPLVAVCVTIVPVFSFGPGAKCGAGVDNTCVRGQASNWTTVGSATECCEACLARGALCQAWQLTTDKATRNCALKPAAGEMFAGNCSSGTTVPPPPPPPQCPGPIPKPPVPAPTLVLGAVKKPSKPHVFMVLQDDLGHDDVTFTYGNTVNSDVTGNITATARAGIVLERHYVHWHCSPTRRTFLTGRLPLHHSEFLSGNDSDDIDLRWTTIAEKLKPAGYATYWFGKGHTGYKSYYHLPLQLGFDAFTGFLGVADDGRYSASLYGGKAHETLLAYDPTVPDAKPLFFYLPWQNVHAPYQAPNNWTGDVLRGMLSATDAALGNVVITLKAKGMWDNTVLFYCADNGGTDRGSNWPLRGSKHSNWEGGMRAAAFISGGLIPPALRGTRSSVVSHIADWYSTICVLAGVSFADDSPIKPLPIDPSNRTKDIYANGAYPGVDGVDLWPFYVTDPQPTNSSAAHPDGLWLSEEVMVIGDYKIVVAQQEQIKTNSGPTLGWKCGGLNHTRCDTTVSAECGENPDTKGPATPQCDTWVKATDEQCKCGCSFKDRSVFTPCLFDVANDPSEYTDLSALHPEMREQMWASLNRTNLEQYMHRSDEKVGPGRSPPELLGYCNASCATKYWAQYPGQSGPACGVPGCTA
eukprot:gene7231-22231_t